jgi:acyl carrier protein
MNREELMQKVNGIFMDVMQNPLIVIKDETTANDVAEWDSLSHIHLVLAIERAFNLRFTSREIQGWENVGEMIDCIHSKIQ